MSTTAKPKIKTFQLASPAQDIRLDIYVTQALPKLSRSYVQKLIEQGYILVNGWKAKASRKLVESDLITIELPPPTYPVAEPMPLAIIYENKDILVVDKPAGLTVHPAKGHPSHTLVNAILAHCPDLAMSSDLPRPGIVHRLDKDTSGLMVIVKNDFARAHLINQFKSHTVTKGYLVLVKGRLPQEHGVIEAPIGRDPHNRKKMTIIATGRKASTQYQVREYLCNKAAKGEVENLIHDDAAKLHYTLLEVTPRTGRMHQIRVHLASIGYPVIGDAIYGTNHSIIGRQFIHAYLLGFCLPSTNEYKEFTCDLPTELKQALELLAHEA
jgi:23S rRNA pseudouridine1911/1915/1917 synthase